jgi:tRNA dimethylallyltransferase
MRLIGYRQILEHLEGATTLAEASQKAVAATRQLARRQLTWLRAEPGAEWFDAFDTTTPERIESRVAEWFRKRGIPARRC